jgi:hypothetical protein
VESAGSALGRGRSALELGFELTSVAPLAGFAVLHLGSYARVLFGALEIGSRHAPSGLGLCGEVLGIWLPLGFHAALAGPLWRWRRTQPAVARSTAWLALHRLTGAVLAVFIADHFVRFRLPILSADRYPADSVLVLARELSSTVAGFPLLAAWHALGTLALSFHLAYGLMRIAERRASPAALGRWRVVCGSIGVLSAVFGTLTVVRFAAG